MHIYEIRFLKFLDHGDQVGPANDRGRSISALGVAVAVAARLGRIAIAGREGDYATLT